MDNFQYWKNEIADIPMKENGRWYDLETGLEYDRNINYRPSSKSARTNLSNKSLESRDVAKKLGGKALKGSNKQKEWAEKIRCEKLSEMNKEHAVIAVNPNIQSIQHSKFWIENRDLHGREIGSLLSDILSAVASYKKNKDDCFSDKAKELAIHLKSFSI